MRFFATGPNIPSHLLEQQSLGNVIFFCGAGVSMPAGMKDFWGLTKAIVDHLTPEQASQAFDGEPGLDRIFNRLVRECGRRAVDQRIYEELKTPRKPRIDCHRWILSLSKGVNGTPQVITTNFDLLFERAMPRIPWVVPPLLPDLDLQSRIDGIVYLHGRLTKPAPGSVANYVVSSSDFGRAYLSEGWAGRFVKALRERFTLVFLGYRAEDPPMRYLLEGLNSRGNDAFNSPIYAFVPGDAGDAEEEWHDRGVTPICYDKADGHSALWKTLEVWAGSVEDPEAWRNRLLGLAAREPEDLAPFERGQVAQLVSTKQGAKLFADADPRPPASWMCVFDNHARFAKPRSRSWDDRTEVDPLDLFGLDDDPERPVSTSGLQAEARGINLLAWRQGDAIFPERTSLTGGPPQWLRPLPERLFHLSRWFASVSHQVAAVWWAAGWKTLDATLLSEVQRQFQVRRRDYSPVAAQFWRLYLEFNERAIPDVSDFSWFDFRRLLPLDGWSHATLRAFTRLIEPRVEFTRPPYDPPCPPRLPWEEVHHRRAFEGVVRVLERHGENLEVPEAHLAEVVELVRQSLVRCSALLDEVGTLYWRTPSLHPTGARGEYVHGKKAHHFLWFKTLFDQLSDADPQAARREVGQWPRDDEYFFGKLTIYAAMKSAVVSGSDAYAMLLELSDEIFWAREQQREFLFTLRARWGEFSEKQRRRLERRIAGGPPRYENEKAAEFRRRRAADAASRLRWLELNQCALSPVTARTLSRLKRVDPRWSDGWAQSADDSLDPKGGIVERVTELRGLDQLPLSEVIAGARQRSEDRIAELKDYRPFEGFVASHPFRALSALRLALRKGEFPVRYWQNLLSCWPEDTDVRLRWLAAEALGLLSSENALQLRYYLPQWLRKQLPALAKQDRRCALRIFDAVAAPYLDAASDMTKSGLGTSSVGGVVQDRSEVSINKAINGPVGTLAQCLWDFIPPGTKPRRRMPTDVGSRFEKLFAIPGDGGGHAVCIVTQHMAWLDYWYRNWATEVVLPLFSLQHPKAEAAWHGLARDQSWIGVAALRALNPDFIAMLKGEVPWTLDESEFRCHMQRLVELSRPIDKGGAIVTFEQVRSVLMAVSDERRADAVSQLIQILSSDRDKQLWKSFVKPFIENAWPRQMRFRTERASREFARLAESAEDDFPDVVRTLLDLDLLRPVAHLDMFTYRISKQQEEGQKDFAFKYPAQTLQLLNALIADDRSQMPYELGKTLEVIAEIDPSLRQAPAWRRLQDLAG